MYGMYYVGGELVMYNDPKVKPLKDTLEEIFDDDHHNYHSNTSVQDAIQQLQEQPSPKHQRLSQELQDLAVAGYGNTAGCCDLKQLSISQLMEFEHHWETNELEGDFSPKVGMHGIVQAYWETYLQPQQEKNRLQLRLHTKVDKVVRGDNGGIQIQLCTDDNTTMNGTATTTAATIQAHAVVVTVPPPLLPALFPDTDPLPATKRDALQYIGFERAIKVICKFRRRLWPEKLQSVISAGLDIPEIWFKTLTTTMEADDDDDDDDTHTTCYYLAVGFLVSTAADQFLEKLQTTTEEEERESSSSAISATKKSRRNQRAADLQMQQLAQIFSLPLSEVVEAHVETLVYDWKDDHPTVQGGYMFPKVGIQPKDLQALAEPMWDSRLFFAGEATNTNACCTVQAAMETGIRAAREVHDALVLLGSSSEEQTQTQT
jgi:hypothetical protein